MRKFEYEIAHLYDKYKNTIILNLNRRGEKGWELVDIKEKNRWGEHECLFKREIIEETTHEQD